jgi:DNA-binding transcriptional LysR family regulator
VCYNIRRGAVTVDLIKLKTFYTVAQLGSFSRAAETLYFSQPAISAQIKDLEYGYGEALFNRVGRKIELTQAGEILLHYVENILKIYDESKYAVNCLKEYNQGRINLGSSSFPGTHYLPPVLAAYLADNPEVSVSITVKNAKKIKEMVLKKELELGIIGSIDTLSHDADLEETVLLQDRIVLAMDHNHPLSRKDMVDVSDLEKLSIISAFKNTVSRQVIRKLYFKHGIELKICYEIENKSMIKTMVQNGLGCAFFASLEVEKEAKAGWLKILPIREEDLFRNILLIHLRDRKLSPAGDGLVRFLMNKRAEPLGSGSAPDGLE